MFDSEKILVKNLMMDWYDSRILVHNMRKDYPELIASFENKYPMVFDTFSLEIFHMEREQFSKIWSTSTYLKLKNKYEVLILQCSDLQARKIFLIREIKAVINKFNIMLVRGTALYQTVKLSPNYDYWLNKLKLTELNYDEISRLIYDNVPSIDTLTAKIDVIGELIYGYNQMIVADMVKTVDLKDPNNEVPSPSEEEKVAEAEEIDLKKGLYNFDTLFVTT